jgi:acyl-CoA thioester hydrolase
MELGLGPSQLHEQGLLLRASDQHVRFHHELRPGAGYTLSAGVVSGDESSLATYAELNTTTGALSASALTELQVIDAESGVRAPWPKAIHSACQSGRVQVPAHGGARGIDRAAPRFRPSYGEAVERGLIGAFLGPVQAEDCDRHGVLREVSFMARISDGMSHFFHATSGGPRPSGIGGAALEYRFVFYEWPSVDDVIEVRSGVKAVGRKTLHIDHYIFDRETGRCAAAAEAVVVWFDLSARKSIEIPAEARAQLEAHVIPGLSL